MVNNPANVTNNVSPLGAGASGVPAASPLTIANIRTALSSFIPQAVINAMGGPNAIQITQTSPNGSRTIVINVPTIEVGQIEYSQAEIKLSERTDSNGQRILVVESSFELLVPDSMTEGIANFARLNGYALIEGKVSIIAGQPEMRATPEQILSGLQANQPQVQAQPAATYTPVVAQLIASGSEVPLTPAAVLYNRLTEIGPNGKPTWQTLFPPEVVEALESGDMEIEIIGEARVQIASLEGSPYRFNYELKLTGDGQGLEIFSIYAQDPSQQNGSQGFGAMDALIRGVRQLGFKYIAINTSNDYHNVYQYMQRFNFNMLPGATASMFVAVEAYLNTIPELQLPSRLPTAENAIEWEAVMQRRETFIAEHSLWSGSFNVPLQLGLNSNPAVLSLSAGNINNIQQNIKAAIADGRLALTGDAAQDVINIGRFIEANPSIAYSLPAAGTPVAAFTESYTLGAQTPVQTYNLQPGQTITIRDDISGHDYTIVTTSFNGQLVTYMTLDSSGHALISEGVPVGLGNLFIQRQGDRITIIHQSLIPPMTAAINTVIGRKPLAILQPVISTGQSEFVVVGRATEVNYGNYKYALISDGEKVSVYVETPAGAMIELGTIGGAQVRVGPFLAVGNQVFFSPFQITEGGINIYSPTALGTDPDQADLPGDFQIEAHGQQNSEGAYSELTFFGINQHYVAQGESSTWIKISLNLGDQGSEEFAPYARQEAFHRLKEICRQQGLAAPMIVVEGDTLAVLVPPEFDEAKKDALFAAVDNSPLTAGVITTSIDDVETSLDLETIVQVEVISLNSNSDPASLSSLTPASNLGVHDNPLIEFPVENTGNHLVSAEMAFSMDAAWQIAEKFNINPRKAVIHDGYYTIVLSDGQELDRLQLEKIQLAWERAGQLGLQPASIDIHSDSFVLLGADGEALDIQEISFAQNGGLPPSMFSSKPAGFIRAMAAFDLRSSNPELFAETPAPVAVAVQPVDIREIHSQQELMQILLSGRSVVLYRGASRASLDPGHVYTTVPETVVDRRLARPSDAAFEAYRQANNPNLPSRINGIFLATSPDAASFYSDRVNRMEISLSPEVIAGIQSGQITSLPVGWYDYGSYATAADYTDADGSIPEDVMARYFRGPRPGQSSEVVVDPSLVTVRVAGEYTAPVLNFLPAEEAIPETSELPDFPIENPANIEIGTDMARDIYDDWNLAHQFGLNPQKVIVANGSYQIELGDGRTVDSEGLKELLQSGGIVSNLAGLPPLDVYQAQRLAGNNFLPLFGYLMHGQESIPEGTFTVYINAEGRVVGHQQGTEIVLVDDRGRAAGTISQEQAQAQGLSPMAVKINKAYFGDAELTYVESFELPSSADPALSAMLSVSFDWNNSSLGNLLIVGFNTVNGHSGPASTQLAAQLTEFLHAHKVQETSGQDSSLPTGFEAELNQIRTINPQLADLLEAHLRGMSAEERATLGIDITDIREFKEYLAAVQDGDRAIENSSEFAEMNELLNDLGLNSEMEAFSQITGQMFSLRLASRYGNEVAGIILSGVDFSDFSRSQFKTMMNAVNKAYLGNNSAINYLSNIYTAEQIMTIRTTLGNQDIRRFEQLAASGQPLTASQYEDFQNFIAQMQKPFNAELLAALGGQQKLDALSTQVEAAQQATPATAAPTLPAAAPTVDVPSILKEAFHLNDAQVSEIMGVLSNESLTREQILEQLTAKLTAAEIDVQAFYKEVQSRISQAIIAGSQTNLAVQGALIDRLMSGGSSFGREVIEEIWQDAVTGSIGQSLGVASNVGQFLMEYAVEPEFVSALAQGKFKLFGNMLGTGLAATGAGGLTAGLYNAFMRWLGAPEVTIDLGITTVNVDNLLVGVGGAVGYSVLLGRMGARGAQMMSRILGAPLIALQLNQLLMDGLTRVGAFDEGAMDLAAAAAQREYPNLFNVLSVVSKQHAALLICYFSNAYENFAQSLGENMAAVEIAANELKQALSLILLEYAKNNPMFLHPELYGSAPVYQIGDIDPQYYAALEQSFTMIAQAANQDLQNLGLLPEGPTALESLFGPAAGEDPLAGANNEGADVIDLLTAPQTHQDPIEVAYMMYVGLETNSLSPEIKQALIALGYMTEAGDPNTENPDVQKGHEKFLAEHGQAQGALVTLIDAAHQMHASTLVNGAQQVQDGVDMMHEADVTGLQLNVEDRWLRILLNQDSFLYNFDLNNGQLLTYLMDENAAQIQELDQQLKQVYLALEAVAKLLSGEEVDVNDPLVRQGIALLLALPQ